MPVISRKWMHLAKTLPNVQNNSRTIDQDIDGDSGGVRSVFRFQVSLDTRYKGTNYCTLNFACSKERKKNVGCRDDKDVHLSFEDFSLRVNIQVQCNEKSSFTKWVHVDFPNSNLKCNYTAPGERIAALNDPKFLSIDKLYQMHCVEKCKPNDCQIACELVIFGALVEIKENVRNEEVMPKVKRGSDDLSFGVSLSSSLLKSRYNSSVVGGQLRVHDVKFVTKNGNKSIGASKFLLAAESTVFRKMFFESDMVEKSTGIVVIDTQFEAMETFVKLTQCEEVCSVFSYGDVQHFLQVISIAHKYQVDRVLDFSIMIVMAARNTSLIIKDVMEMHFVGELYNIPDFPIRAFQWIKWKCGTATGKKEVFEFLKTATASTDFFLEFCDFLL